MGITQLERKPAMNNDRTANRTHLNVCLFKMGLVHSAQCDTGKQASENSLACSL